MDVPTSISDDIHAPVSISGTGGVHEPASISHIKNNNVTYHTIIPILSCLLCVLDDYIGIGVLMHVLHFYLKDNGNLTISEIEMWSGIISSSQFVAVMVACIFMGPVSDCLGAKRTIQIVMFGNVVFYCINAWVVYPSYLLALRLCIGLCSPPVPSLVYIFEVVSSEHAVIGTTTK